MLSTLKNNPAFELKGSLLTLTVMHLLSADINLFTAQLRYHAQKTPNLFKNMPLVIDLQRANPEQEIDFLALQHQLREHGLIPVGVRHGNEPQNNAAQAAGLAILSNQTGKSRAKAAADKHSSAAPTLPQTLLITKPVRSGQQIYARQGNLVVLAPVSHGAEVLADGHIHIYDILRGRALAGVSGDKTARIFCHKLAAELVSIAGYYKLNEELPKIDSPAVQIYLDNDALHVEGLPVQYE